MREFKVGESVMARNYQTSGDKWISGVITYKNGDLSYEVKLQSGNYCKRHIDQIVERGNFVEVQDNWLDPYSTSFNDNFQPTMSPSHSNTESSQPSRSNSTTIDSTNQPSRYPIRRGTLVITVNKIVFVPFIDLVGRNVVYDYSNVYIMYNCV